MARLVLSILFFLPGVLSAQQAVPAMPAQEIERAINQQLIASAQRALDVERTVPRELRTSPMAAPTRRPPVDEPFVALARGVYIERSLLTRPRPADAVRVYPSDAR